MNVVNKDNLRKSNSDIKLQGRFIIQKIYEMDLIDKASFEEIHEVLNKNLPKFKRGTPDKPGSGFKIIRTKKPPIRVEEDPLLLEIFENLIIIEYQTEKYDSIIIDYDDDKPITKKFPHLITNHIFIIYPNYIIFKGSKRYIEILESNFFNIVKDKIKKR